MPRISGRQPTKFRQAFAKWESGIGKSFFEHTPGSPNYIPKDSYRAGRADDTSTNDKDGKKQDTIEETPSAIGYQVFPANPRFLSQPVLSEELKDAVWKAVSQGGSSLRQASVDFKMDIRRVGAVVRLKEVEKQWKAEGKQLASVYSKAVMEMLPQTPLSKPRQAHEPINDLMVLPSTRTQLFWPVAESQHFTRVEAGKAFDNSLLPAESRIPHPQLYKIAKGVAEGGSYQEVQRREWSNIEEKDVDDYMHRQSKSKKREARTTTIQTPRSAYRFESVTVNQGSIGKLVDGIGSRYGIPHQDRKRGQNTIPTKVDG